MPQSFSQELSGLPKSHNLAVSLERAYDYAREGGQGTVRLEHLLLALTEDSEAVSVLQACSVDITRLRTDVARYLGRLGEEPGHADPAANPTLIAIVQHAAAAAQKSGRAKLNGAIVLAAIVGEGSSNAAELLQGQGLTFQSTLAALQKAPAPDKTIPGDQSVPAASHAQSSSAVTAPSPEPATTPTAPPKPSAEQVLAEVRERINTQIPSRTVSQAAPAPAPTSQSAPAKQPVAAPTPAAPSPPQPSHAVRPEPATAPSASETGSSSIPKLADKWAQAIERPKPAAAVPAPSPAHEIPTPATIASPQLSTNTASAPATQTPISKPSPVDPPAMAPWPEPRDRNRQPPPGPVTTRPSAPHPADFETDHGNQINGNFAGAPFPSPDDVGSPAPAQMMPAPPSRGPAPRPTPMPMPIAPPGPGPGPTPGPAQANGQPLARVPVPGNPTRPPQRKRPANPAPPANISAPKKSAAPQNKSGTLVEAGQLLENIPRYMRVAIPVKIEARIARDDVQSLAAGMQGVAPAHRHDLVVTKAMSVKLKAPDGGFWIETASPETQWIENTLGQLHDDYASWRWSVTPKKRGAARLQFVVSARTVGTDGLAAETPLPDQIITVKVRTNYKQIAKTLGGWLLAALAGGAVSALGAQFIGNNGWKSLLNFVGF